MVALRDLLNILPTVENVTIYNGVGKELYKGVKRACVHILPCSMLDERVGSAFIKDNRTINIYLAHAERY